MDVISGVTAGNGTNTYTWERQEPSPDDYHETRALTGSGGVLRIHALQGGVLSPPWTWVPYRPVPGQSWQDEISFLKNGSNVTVSFTSTIHSTNASITVPAGTFVNCLVIRGHSSDGSFTEQWFARGVGMVSDKNYEDNDNWQHLAHSEDLVTYSLK